MAKSVAIFWLLISLTSNLAQAIDSIDLGMGTISGADWKAEGVKLQLKFSGPDAAIFQISAKSIQHPSLPFVLQSPVLDCIEGTLTSGQIGCQKGLIDIQHPWLKKGRIPVSFNWIEESRKLALNTGTIYTVFGNLSIKVNQSQQDWHAQLTGKRLNAEKMLHAFQDYLPDDWPEELVLTTMMTANLNLKGQNSVVRAVDWQVEFGDFGFSDSEGAYLAESLAGKWQGRGRYSGSNWRGKQDISLRSGALLTPFFYLEPGNKPIDIGFAYDYHETKGDISVSKFNFRDPETISFSAEAAYRITEAAGESGLKSLKLNTDPINLPVLYQRYVQPILAESLFESLELAGQLQVAMQMEDYELSQINTRLLNVFAEHKVSEEINGSLFALYNVEGEVNWQASGLSKPSKVRWEGGHLLENINIGPTVLPLSLYGGEIELASESKIPLFDGALNAEKFRVGLTDVGPKVEFQGYLTPISMESFSEALGWPILSGQLSGMVPGVTYEEGRLSVDGMALFKVFEGNVVIRDLVLEDLFGVLPVLSADITMKNLDLEALTRTFSFGKITGKLDGRIDSLRLEDWQPIAFDARFATPENDSSRHRISQKAVDNISNLGGAGVSGALSRSFLRFFEEFSYDKLGITCRLENGVCEMGGIEPAKQGYYLVKGGGLPRIDIVGFNTSTDWHVLISKLEQISEGGAPVIE
ncbi:hypothetical protein [Solemya velesiana gill symbiont]|uniref:Dicarboxylate transport domain-containing protein n=1 Tax=Solemya velesiana gill symbiont TaxID=1918948 RepID=A0A1T2KX25_9GAMM|nr:hypothetical protein [Solemya velesiana gill symbiont]OOZ37383.1 hypothetical protein BOW51_02715 [Solemya velesiana gill symbiont]